MVLTINKPDVRRFIAWIESADWNPCISNQHGISYTDISTDVELQLTSQPRNLFVPTHPEIKCQNRIGQNGNTV